MLGSESIFLSDVIYSQYSVVWRCISDIMLLTDFSSIFFHYMSRAFRWLSVFSRVYGIL